MFQTLQSQNVVGGAEQFDGTAGRGLFLFPFSTLPNDRKIVVERVGIFAAGATANWIECYWEYSTGFGSERILIGSADATSLATPNGDLAVTFCAGIVPRNEDRTFWSLIVISDGLDGPAQATITISRGDS